MGSIIRGEWDGMCTEDDAKWLFNALKASPIRRTVTISRGSHLMIWRKAATRSIAKPKPSSPAMTLLPSASAKPHERGGRDFLRERLVLDDAGYVQGARMIEVLVALV